MDARLTAVLLVLAGAIQAIAENVTVAVFYNKPWVFLDNDNLRGLDVKVLEKVFQIDELKNDSLQYDKTDAGKVGTKTGSDWDGVVGKVAADSNGNTIGVGGIIETGDMNTVLQVSKPYLTSKVAMLLKSDIAVTSFGDLLKNGSTIEYGCVKDSPVAKMFGMCDNSAKNASKTDCKKIQAYLEANTGDQPKNDTEAFKKVKEGNYVWIVDEKRAQFFSSMECSVKVLNDEMFDEELKYVIAIKKGSPLLTNIDKAIDAISLGTLEKEFLEVLQALERPTCGGSGLTFIFATMLIPIVASKFLQ